MSWTAPKTWFAGYTVLAADLNQQIRDNMNFLVTLPIDSTTGKLQSLKTILASINGICYTASSLLTPADNSGTGDTTLQSYSMPGATLPNVGDSVRISSWGTWVNNANSKFAKQWFGASQLTGFVAFNISVSGQWFLQSIIARITGTTQTAVAYQRARDSATNSYNKCDVTACAETLSGSVTIKTTAQGGATSDLTGTAQITEVLRTP